MKRYINIIALLALVIMLVSSCKKYDYTYTYEGDNYVQFTQGSGTFFVLEDPSVTFQIQFQIIGEAPSANITMPVAFLDSAEISGNWVRSTIVPGEKGVGVPDPSVTIAAGDFTGSLTVTGTYDSLEFGEIDTILVQLNEGTVKADSYNNIFLLKVQKYYPFLAEEYPGHYSGNYWGLILGTEVPASPGLTIVLGEAENTLVITEGFYQEQIDNWGETWTDGPYPITIYMNDSDPTNFTVEIPEVQYIGTTNDTWDYWAQPYPAPGSFNAASKELTITFYVSVYGGDQPPQDIGEYVVQLDAAPPSALPRHHDNK
jgi:hypothetical protein